MQLVSASKLKKVKDQAEGFVEYSEILRKIMSDVAKDISLSDLPERYRSFFLENTSDLDHLLVVMSSERGLCGGFNASIVRKVKQDIKDLQSSGKKVKLLVVGKKGMDALKGQYSDLIMEYYHDAKGQVESLSMMIKNKIMELVESDQISGCSIYYNHFKNAMSQIPTMRALVPAKFDQEDKSNSGSVLEYEGDDVIEEILHLYMSGEISNALLQSKASEEGARMTAMDNATRNAKELENKLTLQLNRSRQAMITTELTEIISGAEAV
jgi:F-type H+-transporting ATPase subunit gamma